MVDEPKAQTVESTEETHDALEKELIESAGQDPNPPAPQSDEDDPEEKAKHVEAEAADTATQASTSEPAHDATEGRGTDSRPKDEHEPVKPEPAGTAPAAAGQVDPLQAELAKLDESIASDEFDPFSKDGKQTMLRRQDVTAQIAAGQVRAEQVLWMDISDKYGIDEGKLRKAWREEVKKAESKYGKGTEAARAVATERWEERIPSLKTPQSAAVPTPAPKGAKVSPPVSKTPITPQGGRVTPPSAGAVPPQPKEMTEEEELVAYMRKNVPEGIKALGR